jgi:hypothetical protein
MTHEEALHRLAEYLRFYHPRLTPDDLVLSSVRGYWRMKEPCDGACRHPIHGTLGNRSPAYHTISFGEHGTRDRFGRFVRPYRVWEALHD